jgi:hypothetical protein
LFSIKPDVVFIKACSEILNGTLIRTVPLDCNGFAHDRMIRILVGIRIGCAFPPIPIERIEHGAHLYRLRDGTHRFYASRTLGFSHVPAEICEVY